MGAFASVYLNLGAGVQSTTLYLLALERRPGCEFAAALFADTGDESDEVYRHLDWLRTLGGPPILTCSAGRLSDTIRQGVKSPGGKVPARGRWANVPAFTAPPEGERPDGYDPRREAGRVPRQCTKEFKIEPLRRLMAELVRRETGTKRVPRGTVVTSLVGMSSDEVGRAQKVNARYARGPKWQRVRFPLIEMGWSRRGCADYLRTRVPHPVAKSACYHCPYTDDWRWKEMKETQPELFARACAVDRALREGGGPGKLPMHSEMYLHRKCVPLEVIDFASAEPPRVDNFTLFDCDGMCGQ